MNRKIFYRFIRHVIKEEYQPLSIDFFLDTFEDVLGAQESAREMMSKVESGELSPDSPEFVQSVKDFNLAMQALEEIDEEEPAEGLSALKDAEIDRFGEKISDMIVSYDIDNDLKRSLDIVKKAGIDINKPISSLEKRKSKILEIIPGARLISKDNVVYGVINKSTEKSDAQGVFEGQSFILHDIPSIWDGKTPSLESPRLGNIHWSAASSRPEAYLMMLGYSRGSWYIMDRTGIYSIPTISDVHKFF